MDTANPAEARKRRTDGCPENDELDLPSEYAPSSGLKLPVDGRYLCRSLPFRVPDVTRPACLSRVFLVTVVTQDDRWMDNVMEDR